MYVQNRNNRWEKMYNAREEIMNILNCVYFEKLCNGITFFPELNLKKLKEGITFPT